MRVDKCGDSLPKNLAVCLQYVRCGKSPCACVEGEKHGPYWYVFWRDHGRLRKQYLPTVEGEGLKRKLADRRLKRRRQAAAIAEARGNLRRTAEIIREIERPWER